MPVGKGERKRERCRCEEERDAIADARNYSRDRLADTGLGWGSNGDAGHGSDPFSTRWFACYRSKWG
jgi:hypothetical protein